MVKGSNIFDRAFFDAHDTSSPVAHAINIYNPGVVKRSQGLRIIFARAKETASFMRGVLLAIAT